MEFSSNSNEEIEQLELKGKLVSNKRNMEFHHKKFNHFVEANDPEYSKPSDESPEVHEKIEAHEEIEAHEKIEVHGKIELHEKSEAHENSVFKQQKLMKSTLYPDDKLEANNSFQDYENIETSKVGS